MELVVGDLATKNGCAKSYICLQGQGQWEIIPIHIIEITMNNIY